MIACKRVRARDMPTCAIPRYQSSSISVSRARMTTSFSKFLKSVVTSNALSGSRPWRHNELVPRNSALIVSPVGQESLATLSPRCEASCAKFQIESDHLAIPGVEDGRGGRSPPHSDGSSALVQPGSLPGEPGTWSVQPSPSLSKPS